MHDLGVALAARGHHVTLVTSHPGPSQRTVEEGIEVVRARRPPSFPPLRWYEDHVDSVPAAVYRLSQGRYDVAHAFHPAYAWAAGKARRFGGPPFAFSFHGIPERGYLVQRRYRLEMMQRAIATAGRVTVLSEAAAEVFRRYLLIEPEVLPGGVFADQFAIDEARSDQPTLVCAASLGDPRKRADLLFAAFTALREERPDVRLRLVRTPDPFMSPLVPELPEGAEWVDAGSTKALAREYGAAHASVLTSVGEAFGLVVLESLAAGTPVVATRGSASAELVTEGKTGELFEPDDAGSLTQALRRALELGGKRKTPTACQAAAQPYDWDGLVIPHERLYEGIVAEGSDR